MAILRCVIHGKFSWGDETRNVFHFGGDDATVAQGQTIVDAVIDALMDDKAKYTTDYSFVGGTLYNEDTPGVPGTYLAHTSGDQTGTAVGDPMPGQIALLLNFWANTVRPNRKRTYVAGLTEGSMLDGLWNTGIQTYFGGVVDDLLDFDTVSGIDARLASYACLGADPCTPSINFVTQSRVEQVPATQRRRRRGTGI